MLFAVQLLWLQARHAATHSRHPYRLHNLLLADQRSGAQVLELPETVDITDKGKVRDEKVALILRLPISLNNEALGRMKL